MPRGPQFADTSARLTMQLYNIFLSRFLLRLIVLKHLYIILLDKNNFLRFKSFHAYNLMLTC